MKNNVNNLNLQVRIIRQASKDYVHLVKKIKAMKRTLRELEDSFPSESGSLLSFLETINTDLVSIDKVEEGKVYDRPYYREKEYEVVATGDYRKAEKWLENTLRKSKALSLKSVSFEKDKEGQVKVDVNFSYVSVKKGG